MAQTPQYNPQGEIKSGFGFTVFLLFYKSKIKWSFSDAGDKTHRPG
jgi:hypothetical protein